MRGILIFLISMLLIPVSLAGSLDVDYQILYDKVVVTEKFNFEKETSFILQVPEKAFAISVYADNKQVESTNNEYDIRSANKVEVTYITKELLEKTTKNFFLTDIKVQIDLEELTVKLTLPENSILDKPLTNEGSIFPKPTKTETDGQRLSFIWMKQDFSKEDSFSIFVIFREKTSILLIVILIIIFVLIFIAYLVLKQKKQAKIIKKPKRKKIKEIEFHLIESEKAVINALKKADRNELWQKQLQLQTGFSKAKLSRVIRNLESRNLIKKIPLGNTNKIMLK